MVSLTHRIVVTGDNNDRKQVSKDAWNEAHVLTGTAGTLIRFNASTGVAEDATIASLGLLDEATGDTLYAPITHDHDSDYAALVHSHVIADVTGLQAALDGKSGTGHTHDDRYYTEAEVDALLSGVGTGDLLAANNLNDVASAATARDNLGLEIGVDVLGIGGGTLTGDLSVPDEAYNAAAWDASTEVPTKNAVRDKFESLVSGGGVPSGVAFPGSPSDGDLFRRTDRQIEYFYSTAAANWLSSTVYTQQGAPDTALPKTVTTLLNRLMNPWAGKYSLYVEELVVWHTIVGTGNWTVTAAGWFSASPANFAGLTTNGTLRTTINTVVATAGTLDVTCTENSGTGSFYGIASVIYRLVG